MISYTSFTEHQIENVSITPCVSMIWRFFFQKSEHTNERKIIEHLSVEVISCAESIWTEYIAASLTEFDISFFIKFEVILIIELTVFWR